MEVAGDMVEAESETQITQYITSISMEVAGDMVEAKSQTYII